MKKVLLFLFAFVFTTDSFANDIAANVTNPVCDNDTLSQYNGTVNVEIDWVPNTIALRWYSDDVQLNMPVESQSCVYDGAMVIPPQPTKTGYTFKGWEVKYVIPGEYTQLQYLESTGTQYVDTEMTVKANTLAKFEYQYTDSSVYENWVFGQVAGTGLSCFGYRTTRIWWFTNMDTYFSDALKHTVEYKSDGNIYRDGTIIGSKGQSFGGVQSYTILLFGERNDNNAIFKGKVKIFYFELFEGTTLVRNFIPARRNSDNVVGMYDTVTGTFFTNAGTGTFIAGPDLQ